MVREVLQYIDIQQNLRTTLQQSPYKMEHFIRVLGMNAATFYRKLKNKTFNENEILKIVTVLKPKEAIFIELEESLERGYQQSLRGEGRPHEQVLSELRKKFATED